MNNIFPYAALVAALLVVITSCNAGFVNLMSKDEDVFPPIIKGSAGASVSGAGQVGAILTAITTGVIKEGAGDWTYQWTRDGADIDGAASQTYTTVLADYNTTVGVKIGSTRNTGTVSAGSGVFVDTYADMEGSVNISGDGQVGAVLEAVTAAAGKEAAGIWTYQWTRTTSGDGDDISGATAPVYIPLAADFGTTISVKIGSAAGEVTLSPYSGVYVDTYRDISGGASISGEGRVGAILSADVSGVTKEAAGDWTFQWLRNGAVIPGAASQTYIPVVADYGATVSVRIGSTKNSDTITAPGLAVNTYAALSGSVSVIGTPKAGSGLTVDTSNLSWESSGSLSYDWKVAGVSRGSNNYYTAAASDLGKTITVTVSGSLNTGSVTSAPTAPAAPKDSNITVTFSGMPAAQTIGLSGAPAVSLGWVANETLAVSVDTSAGWASGGGVTFQWYLDGPALSDETGASVTLHAGNYSLGTHTLSVKVTKGTESYSKTLVFTIVQ